MTQWAWCCILNVFNYLFFFFCAFNVFTSWVLRASTCGRSRADSLRARLAQWRLAGPTRERERENIRMKALWEVLNSRRGSNVDAFGLLFWFTVSRRRISRMELCPPLSACSASRRNSTACTGSSPGSSGAERVVWRRTSWPRDAALGKV